MKIRKINNESKELTEIFKCSEEELEILIDGVWFTSEDLIKMKNTLDLLSDLETEL